MTYAFLRYVAYRVRRDPGVIWRLPAIARRRLGAASRARAFGERERAPSPPRAEALPAALWTLTPGRISVILPVFNQAGYLAEALPGVLAQTFGDYEVILVDDGSHDDVEGVLASHAGHPSLRVLRQENRGLPAALNAGFAVASGRSWTWTSADNLVEPGYLARLAAALIGSPDPEMVFADYLAIDEQGRPLGPGAEFRPQNRDPRIPGAIRLPRHVAHLGLTPDNFVGPCFLYRGYIGAALGGYASAAGVEDFDYWLRAATHFEVRHTGGDELLYRYRVHDQSLSGRAKEIQIAEKLAVLRDVHERRQEEADRTLVVQASPTCADRIRQLWPDATVVGPGDPAPHLDAVAVTLGDPALTPSRPETAVVVFADQAESWPTGLSALCRRAGRQNVAVVVRAELPARAACLFDPALVIDPLHVRAPRVLEAFVRERGWAEAGQTPAARPLPRTRRVVMQVDAFGRGGLERVVLDLGQDLRARGTDVTLLVLGTAVEGIQAARDLGWSVRCEPDARDDPGRYGAVIASLRPDLVHAHFSWSGAAHCRAMGIPFLQTVHNCYTWLPQAARDAVRSADAHTAAYACVSEQAARYAALRLGCEVGKMVLMPNGVNAARDGGRPTDRAAVRQARGIDEQARVLLCVGSILPAKGQRALVKALEQARRAGCRYTVILLGEVLDAAYLADLQATARRLGMEDAVVHVDFAENVAPYYDVADVFVQPSVWEGWSLALGEALQAGLPVISTRVGAAAAFDAVENVFLVDPPHQAIEHLDEGSITRLLWHDDPAFVSALSEALASDLACTGVRRPMAPHLATLMSARGAHDAYANLYDWLVQGGSVHGGRRVTAWRSSLA